jgi:hypothetical protein
MVVVKKINRRAIKLTNSADSEEGKEKEDQSPISKTSSDDNSKEEEGKEDEKKDRATFSPVENVSTPQDTNWDGLLNTIQNIGNLILI